MSPTRAACTMCGSKDKASTKLAPQRQGGYNGTRPGPSLRPFDILDTMTQREERPPEAKSLAEHIREAARESGLSVRQIATEADLDQSTLNKFLKGERQNLRLDMADRLFRF